MINVVVFYGFRKSPQYKTHPEFGITFLYWSQKLSLKKVRLQLGVLRYIDYWVHTAFERH